MLVKRNIRKTVMEEREKKEYEGEELKVKLK